ncbi:S41 family peptidase [Roseivirga sp. E12]|uniref:S41 family peptidase n=1 Tax=Roseivirga sp. E12 TaxID=2819237 RepID=UPI001ABC6F37|nr:S41 family peptidase [Roseivirga sp. E12]MBO3697267.1 S41 family peptidase [Roseivirga sp. E12]
MKRISVLSMVLLINSFLCFGQVMELKQKKQIVRELSKVIQKNYVLQDSVSLIAKGLKEIEKSKGFKEGHTPSQFSTYLTTVLRSITKDAHFAVLQDADMFRMALALQQGPSDGNTPSMSFGGRNLNDHRKNFFFTKLEVLNGNVGYLKIEQIPSLESGKPTVDAAMAFLQNTDALIIDLRSNPGGVGGFIPYLMSYFFPEEKELLYSREYMAWDSISHHHTHESLGSKRYLGKPVHLLINRYTGSAATNMAYTMKSFDKATLVGQNTGAGYRGAHSASIYPLADDFVGLVPIGRVVNAKTKTNWRANGVDPDIETPAEDALNVAYENLLQSLLGSIDDTKALDEIKKAIEELESDSNKEENMASVDLSEYAGSYEGTTITWENGKLFTKRSTTPIKLEIVRKEGELFKIILPPNTRGNVPDLRFDRLNGVIVSLTTIRNGQEERTEKRER